jgi:hypothetical protein
MGLIYGHTAQVIAVLSENSRVRCDGTWSQGEGAFPDSSVLDTSEKDPWIRGVRTYQEVVNSKRLYFVGENIDNYDWLTPSDTFSKPSGNGTNFPFSASAPTTHFSTHSRI